VTNGAKVYVCGLITDDIKVVVDELNALGEKSGNGGVAFGFVLALLCHCLKSSLIATPNFVLLQTYFPQMNKKCMENYLLTFPQLFVRSYFERRHLIHQLHSSRNRNAS
jgi:hypothetical protein